MPVGCQLSVPFENEINNLRAKGYTHLLIDSGAAGSWCSVSRKGYPSPARLGELDKLLSANGRRLLQRNQIVLYSLAEQAESN